MKEVQGRARADLDVTPHECYELLAAVDRYPTWFEYVRRVDVLEPELNGTPGLARAEVHVEQSPFGQDFELFMAVRTEPRSAVMLTRLPSGPSDPDRLELIWRVGGEGAALLEFEFDAAASFVPGFLPVGDAGDAIARGAIKAARTALSR